MKKNLFKTMLLAGSLTVLLSFTAFAGEWKQDTTGWWYVNDNGTYATNSWQWIDGNNDGISECYYFDPNGYCLQNTTTPDGYIVDVNGAWTVNGAIQTQAVAAQTTEAQTQEPTEENRYGLGGRESFDIIKGMWIDGTIEDEADLREMCDTTFIGSPVIDELIQEILSTPQTTAQVQAIMPVEVDAGGYIVYLPDLHVTEEESVLYDSVVSYWVETPELSEDFIRNALGNPDTLSGLTEEQRQGLIKGVLIQYPH